MIRSLRLWTCKGTAAVNYLELRAFKCLVITRPKLGQSVASTEMISFDLEYVVNQVCSNVAAPIILCRLWVGNSD